MQTQLNEPNPASATPDEGPVSDVDRLYDSHSLGDHRRAVQMLLDRQSDRLGANPDPARPKVEVSIEPDLPSLAWLCRISAGNRCAISVGPGVEFGRHRLFEGVWDGDFGKGAFQESQYVYGSGVTWRGQLVFVPPKHGWEYLFVLHDAGERTSFVSNSMNFALERAGIDPDGPFFAGIETALFDKTNAATAAGIDKYDPLVMTDGRFSLTRMMFYNFTADADGRIRPIESLPEAPFKDFASCRRFLMDKISAIGANATDRRRQRPLPPITPVSGGYDSACVAVLAAEAGFRDAATIDVTVKGRDDSGAALAERLGMTIVRAEHILGKIVPSLEVIFDGPLKRLLYEFVATPGVGDDVAFLALEQALIGRTFLSGAMGDSIWRRNSSLPPGLPVRVVYGKSLTEFRLRAGFAFVPVPSIGARFPRRVKRITRSPEMAPYTLHAPYDRPIARRIIEESDIPRGSFAAAKLAVSPHPQNHRALFREAVAATRQRYRPAGPRHAQPGFFASGRQSFARLLGLRRLARW